MPVGIRITLLYSSELSEFPPPFVFSAIWYPANGFLRVASTQVALFQICRQAGKQLPHVATQLLQQKWVSSVTEHQHRAPLSHAVQIGQVEPSLTRAHDRYVTTRKWSHTHSNHRDVQLMLNTHHQSSPGRKERQNWGWSLHGDILSWPSHHFDLKLCEDFKKKPIWRKEMLPHLTG